MAIKLNLGGGKNWKMEGWTNLDIAQNGYDLTAKGLSPYASNSVDLIYSSHNIEHVNWKFVPGYIADVYRALKSGGTFRIAVPDIDIMWEMLRDNDKQKLLHNTMYYVGTKITRDVLLDVRELFGFDLTGEKFLDGTMHKAFFNMSSLGILLYNAGFRNLVRKQANESNIPDFQIKSKHNDKGHYLSGFDNWGTIPITLFVEAIK
jgi:SAM-dependent methyltransferase